MKLKRLRCSFCCRGEHEVAKLVAGRRGYICDACVERAREIIKTSPENPPVSLEEPHRRVWRRLFDRARKIFGAGHLRGLVETRNGR